MGTNRGNPALLVVVAGVALGVIFGLLGFTGVLSGRIGFGLAAICLVVAALIPLFYSRSSVIEKTGYASLLFIVAVAFVLPLLTVTQQQDQLSASAAQYNTTLERGAALFGQYCASCHGFQGQGINGPQLNNNPAVAKLTPDDLRGIISGGVRNPNDPSKFLMPAWLDQFGGSLTEEDIGYLVALIQSSSPSVRAQNNLANTNGFDYVLGSLTNPTQIAEYKKEKAGGSKPPATSFNDLTGQASVTIDGQDDATNTSGYGWVAQRGKAQPHGGNNANIIFTSGPKVMGENKSAPSHTREDGTASAQGKDFRDPTKILAANS